MTLSLRAPISLNVSLTPWNTREVYPLLNSICVTENYPFILLYRISTDVDRLYDIKCYSKASQFNYFSQLDVGKYPCFAINLKSSDARNARKCKHDLPAIMKYPAANS